MLLREVCGVDDAVEDQGRGIWKMATKLNEGEGGEGREKIYTPLQERQMVLS